jgi:hypothetical protein
MIDESKREKIDRWIAGAPDFRVVESNPTHDGWESVAREDGEIVYEELDLGSDEPLLNLMAAWCERQTKKVEPRPPVKTSGTDADDTRRWAAVAKDRR